MNSFEKEYLKLSSDSWWYVTRNEVIYKIIKKYCPKNIPTVLDAGCGFGILVKYLNDRGIRTTGIDNEQSFVDYAKRFDCDVRLCDIEGRFELNQKYDVIVLSDVIEHVSDPVKLIKGLSEYLNEEGIFIIFCPAFMFLWSWHDEVNRHKKRYTACELLNIARDAGLKNIFCSYWNITLFIPALIIRNLKNFFNIKTSDFYQFPSLVNSLISFLIKIENYMIIKGIKIPFGVSILSVCCKDQ